MKNKLCKYFKEISFEGRCTCNNDIDDEGDCVYEDGLIHGEPICKFYKPIEGENDE